MFTSKQLTPYRKMKNNQGRRTKNMPLPKTETTMNHHTSVSTVAALTFDEVNFDQEWRSLRVGLNLGCVCVSVIQNHEFSPWTIGMIFKGLLMTNHNKLN